MITGTLIAPYRLPFMAHALLELVILGLAAAVVGVPVLLRRLAFIADAMTHAVFPGLVAGFLLAGYPGELWGALAAGAVTAGALTVATRSASVSQDGALAVLFTGMFGLGVVLVSRQHGYTADLTAFLFGQVLGIGEWDVLSTAIVGALVVAVIAVLRRPLLARAFDAPAARAVGGRVDLLDLVLNVLIALTVVVAARAVGTLLVIALLLVPAAAARLLSDRLVTITALACAFAVTAGWLGLSVSYTASATYGLNLVSGGTVVLVLVAGYALAATGRALVGWCVARMSTGSRATTDPGIGAAR